MLFVWVEYPWLLTTGDSSGQHWEVSLNYFVSLFYILCSAGLLRWHWITVGNRVKHQHMMNFQEKAQLSPGRQSSSSRKEPDQFSVLMELSAVSTVSTSPHSVHQCMTQRHILPQLDNQLLPNTGQASSEGPVLGWEWASWPWPPCPYCCCC